VARLALVTLVVHDYDEAIQYFTGTLGFRLEEDTDLGGGKRWVVIAVDEQGGTGLLLARAVTDAQRSLVGDQTGGRVFLFLCSTDFDADHARLVQAGVRFDEEPRTEPYGRVAVFTDLYGNRWDLVEAG